MQIIHKINDFFFTLFPNVPLSLVSKTKIYSKVNSLQYKLLFGIDLNPGFKEIATDVQVVKKIFNECATVKDGIDPNNKDYILSSISNKRFSGNQVLAFYYVSWALAMLENVKHLGLDFGKEFMMAKKLSL